MFIVLLFHAKNLFTIYDENYVNLFLLLSWRPNSAPGSDYMVEILYFNIRGLHASLDELAVAGSNYDVLVCTESIVSDRRHLSELRT